MSDIYEMKKKETFGDVVKKYNKKMGKRAPIWASVYWLSAFISYALNGSWLWAIFHYWTGFVYIPYLLIWRSHDLINLFNKLYK